jgi:hypothetical protein
MHQVTNFLGLEHDHLIVLRYLLPRLMTDGYGEHGTVIKLNDRVQRLNEEGLLRPVIPWEVLEPLQGTYDALLLLLAELSIAKDDVDTFVLAFTGIQANTRRLIQVSDHDFEGMLTRLKDVGERGERALAANGTGKQEEMAATRESWREAATELASMGVTSTFHDPSCHHSRTGRRTAASKSNIERTCTSGSRESGSEPPTERDSVLSAPSTAPGSELP